MNIQKEIKRHWGEIASYISSILRTSGLSEVEAEEMAIFPGMEELSGMMYVNQFRKQNAYDVIVLDCAPTPNRCGSSACRPRSIGTSSISFRWSAGF